ncbi:hypothetical protein HYC85_000220 [Camellia sinensis]|uniref:AT-hook motif nuclear-localized protein n=1 Tax=Camellia sinensis TaxID=4442 RepID=A0A7J7I376_CAMSI|nr:hypothetical protein HYC85_000220 [Camellia sinensis]
MEPNESGLSSYYHHQHHQHHQQHHQPQPPHHQSPAATSPTNGILQNADNRAPHMVYPNPVPSAVTPPLESVRRKRGRPRKYGTPEQAAAAKRAPSSSHLTKKKEQPFGGWRWCFVSVFSFEEIPVGCSWGFLDYDDFGNAGQGFTPHIISVAAGEDTHQKIMLFMQQTKREICILSASGSISNPCLRQPATSGGNITYEGRFDILSLSGSYIRTELGGRTGGLSVCLSSTDGHIIGGGIGGPLKAAGPVQVIVGTFLIDTKKDIIADAKGVGASVSGVGFQSAVDSSGRVPVRSSEDHQSVSGSQFIIQPRDVQVTNSRATDWRSGTDTRINAGYEFTGRVGHGAHQSPENGDYDHIQD